MQYKNYIWPHNPRIYTIDYARKMAVNKIPFGQYHLQNLGRTNRVMRGEGEFVGEDAYAEFGKLATVFYGDEPGLLLHPLWQPAQAYFVELRLEQEPRPEYVRYSFAFWEVEGVSAGGITTVGVGGGTADAGVSGGDDGPVSHTVVKGETLWGIARAYGVTVEALLALNPQIKNPNLIYAGNEVRVR